MSKFKLTPPFTIGHKVIDREHLFLIEILNEMNEKNLSLDLYAWKQKWIKFCENLEKHNISEESIMEEFGYNYKEMRVAQQEFLKQAKNSAEKCETLANWKDFFFKLRNKFLVQILIVDSYFADYLFRIGYRES